MWQKLYFEETKASITVELVSLLIDGCKFYCRIIYFMLHDTLKSF